MYPIARFQMGAAILETQASQKFPPFSQLRLRYQKTRLVIGGTLETTSLIPSQQVSMHFYFNVVICKPKLSAQVWRVVMELPLFN